MPFYDPNQLELSRFATFRANYLLPPPNIKHEKKISQNRKPTK
jgi:hypothetical protein